PTPVLRGSQVEYFSSRTHGVEARAARAGHGVVAFLEVHRIPTQLIDLRTPVDRAVLVGAPIQDLDVRLVEEHLGELGRLTDTAGGRVVGTLIQRLDHPHPRFYIGEGKARELRDLVQAREADLVIFDEELSPAQGKNLEE